MFHLILAALLELSLVSLVSAAPMHVEGGNAVQWGTGGGVFGFIVLIIDIIVFIEVLKSNRPPLNKVLWCLLVFLFPIVGAIIYFLFSNRAAHNTSGGYEAITS